MLKSLKEKCECVIPSLELPSSSFNAKMVSLSWYCTEDLKIEMSQPKDFIISVLKFGWNSVRFSILTRDYLNAASSGDSWTSKAETKHSFWENQFIPQLSTRFLQLLLQRCDVQSCCFPRICKKFSRALIPPASTCFFPQLLLHNSFFSGSSGNDAVLEAELKTLQGIQTFYLRVKGEDGEEQKSEAGSWVHWAVLKKN